MKLFRTGLCLLAGSCQTYDFEVVTPTAIVQSVKKVSVSATPLKPAMMLLVDTSGSMNTEVSPKVTRLDAMQSAMGQFLTQSGNSLHLGMLPFPGAAACAPGDITQVATRGVPLDEGNEDAARLADAALSVKTKIESLVASGGTPVAYTIQGLATYAPLLDKNKDRFVVLLTDGLPNCNAANQSVATSCTCTVAQPVGTPCVVLGENQCLDDAHSAEEIAALFVRGIRTIVVGFGTDINNPQGANSLAKMARAGSFVRPCTQDSDCNAQDRCESAGVDPCGRPTRACGQSFFQASSATELSNAMQKIRDLTACPPCRQVLALRPSSPEFVSVSVNGVATASGPQTWQYHDNATAPTVEFTGDLCQRLLSSTSAAPVDLEIRVVAAL